MSEDHSEVREASRAASPAKRKKQAKAKEVSHATTDGSKRPSVFQVKQPNSAGLPPATDENGPLLEMFHPGRNSTVAAEMSMVSYSIGENSLDFGGRMDKLAELELLQLWQTLWDGVHDAELLRHAESNPRARWNPYRPLRGGLQMREQVLNSQVVEFKDVIPTDAIYIKGVQLPSGLTAFDPPTVMEAIETLRRPSERSSHLSRPAEYTYEMVPSDHLRAELRVQGASLPIHSASPGLEDMNGMEEILAAAGTPPVDVFALQRDSKKGKGEAAAAAAAEEEADDAGGPAATAAAAAAAGAEEDITPETVHREEMTDLLFQYLWRKVVLPFYVKKEAAGSPATTPADASLAVESLSPSPQETKYAAPFHNQRMRCSSAFAAAAQTTEDAPVPSLAATPGAQPVRRPTTSGPVRYSLTGPESTRVPPPPPPSAHSGGGGGASTRKTTSSATEAAKLLAELDKEHARGDQPKKGKRHKKKRHHSSKGFIEEEVIDADTEASSPGRQGIHLVQRRLSPFGRDEAGSSAPLSVPSASSSENASAVHSARRGQLSRPNSAHASDPVGISAAASESASSALSGTARCGTQQQRNASSGSRHDSPTRETTAATLLQLQLSRNASDVYSASGGGAASPRDVDDAGAAASGQPQMVDSSYASEIHLRHGSAPQTAAAASPADAPTAANKFSSSTPGVHNHLRASSHATVQKAIAVSNSWRAKNAEQMAQLYGVAAKGKKPALSPSSSSSKQSSARFCSPNTGGASSRNDMAAVVSGESECSAAASVKAQEPLQYRSPDARSRNSSHHTSKSERSRPPQTMYFKSNKTASVARRQVLPTTKRLGSPSPSLIRHRGLEPMTTQPQETKVQSAASPNNGSLAEVNWKRRGSSPQGRRLEPLALGDSRLH